MSFCTRSCPPTGRSTASFLKTFPSVREIFSNGGWVRLLPRRGKLPPALPISATTPVVAVLHGSFGSSGNFAALATALQSRGIAVVGFDYAVRGTQNLAPAVQEIAAELAALPTSRKLIIVGHSLGAMVGMFVAHDPRLRGRIAAVIGLGGAFRGLPAAATSPATRLAARLLGVRSFQQLLEFNGTTAPDGVRVISIASDADKVVPWTSSAFGEVRVLRGVPHAWLTDVVPEIVDALEDVTRDWKI